MRKVRISRTSRNPFVVISSVRAPFNSRIAFEATVVPCNSSTIPAASRLCSRISSASPSPATSCLKVPHENASLLSDKLLKHSTLKIYPGFPHGLLTTNGPDESQLTAGVCAQLRVRRSRSRRARVAASSTASGFPAKTTP